LKAVKDMKDILAKKIEAGSASYSLRLLSQDIITAIAKDEDLNKYPKSTYFEIYWPIIRMLALGHGTKPIIYLFHKQIGFNLPENEIRDHISRIKSDYKEFVDIMIAIIFDKKRDFMKLGASEEQAFDCVNNWLFLEFF
jgi:hypothetical protein